MAPIVSTSSQRGNNLDGQPATSSSVAKGTRGDEL